VAKQTSPQPVRRVEKLVLKGFRGATNEIPLEFDTTKPLVMIFGENGTGKSTLVDAIDFVCNEELGSLKDRSFPERHRHVASLGASITDLSVSLTFAGQEWQGRMGRQSPLTTGPDPRPVAHVLRRNSVLRLIEAQPGKRYEAISRFIALPAIDKTEGELRKALADAERRMDKALDSRATAEDLLRDFWEQEGSQGSDHLTWAAEQAGADATSLTRTVMSIDSILQQINSASRVGGNLTRAAEEHNRALERQQQIEEELTGAEAERPRGEGALIDLLQKTRTFLEQSAGAEICPVCESPDKVAGLKDRIDARLSEMRHLVDLRERANAAHRNADAAAAQLLSARKNFVTEVARLGPLVEESTSQTLAALNLDLGKYPSIINNAQAKLAPDASSPDTLREAVALLSTLEPLRGALQTEADENRRTLTRLNNISVSLRAVEAKREEAAEAKRQGDGLRTILSIVEGHRKRFVEETLRGIADTVEQLYEKIHPGEGIGKVRFYLKPNVQASMELDGTFGGREGLPPGAYFSESHLDTLGICVFLALAKHDESPDRIVVLDDVITSADDAHTESFVNLLHDEADHFNQVIVTTHYRNWRDRYRYNQAPQKDVHFIELLEWSLPHGVRHAGTRVVVDDLRHWAAAEPFDRQVVASKCGLQLENLLDYIALKYRCKVPRQAIPHYTLGDLTKAIESKLRRALSVTKLRPQNAAGEENLTRYAKDPTKVDLAQVIARGEAVPEETKLQALIEAVDGLAWIRNMVGCHFNLQGTGIADSEVRKLAAATINLSAALVCDNCGELPSSIKSGNYWACRCRRTQLLPPLPPT
jgi:energy-coupling factor transporter ATP-binding protein EcfA2